MKKVMKQKIDNIVTHQNTALVDYPLRTIILNGRKTIVVPVIMMVEGVHTGSQGPVLHTTDVFIESVSKWVDIPVTISHPEKDGVFISAYSEGVHHVGVIKEPKVVDGKLRALVYLDELKLLTQSPSALNHINFRRPLDVSIGVYCQMMEEQGSWNNETYAAVAQGYVPDHLALLPGEQGACGWADGCGIRVNKGVLEEKLSINLNQNSNEMKDVYFLRKELQDNGIASLLITNEQGFRELMDQVRNLLNGLDRDGYYNYLQEMYDHYFIYEVNARDDGTTLLRQNYTVTETGVLELVGAPEEVRRKVEYLTVQMIRTNNIISTNIKKEDEMNEKTPSPCLVQKVDAIITHKGTQFTESDKEWLLTQSEQVLAKLFPAEESSEPSPQVNTQQAIELLQKVFKTTEEYLSILPTDMQETVKMGLATHQEKKDAIIAAILANSKVWSKEELSALSVCMLTKIANTAKVIDYSALGANGGMQTNTAAEELPVLITPSI